MEGIFFTQPGFAFENESQSFQQFQQPAALFLWNRELFDRQLVEGQIGKVVGANEWS